MTNEGKGEVPPRDEQLFVGHITGAPKDIAAQMGSLDESADFDENGATQYDQEALVKAYTTEFKRLVEELLERGIDIPKGVTEAVSALDSDETILPGYFAEIAQELRTEALKPETEVSETDSAVMIREAGKIEIIDHVALASMFSLSNLPDVLNEGKALAEETAYRALFLNSHGEIDSKFATTIVENQISDILARIKEKERIGK